MLESVILLNEGSSRQARYEYICRMTKQQADAHALKKIYNYIFILVPPQFPTC